MPVYDYKCACGHIFECRQTFESEPFAKCPRCHKVAHRQLHCPPIIFKGSGFYITDHRTDNGGEKPKKAGSEEAAKAEAKTETKPEKSSETKAEKPEKVASKKE